VCQPLQLQIARLPHLSSVDRLASYRPSIVRWSSLFRQAKIVSESLG
jgi:hypothetical protein